MAHRSTSRNFSLMDYGRYEASTSQDPVSNTHEDLSSDSFELSPRFQSTDKMEICRGSRHAPSSSDPSMKPEKLKSSVPVSSPGPAAGALGDLFKNFSNGRNHPARPGHRPSSSSFASEQKTLCKEVSRLKLTMDRLSKELRYQSNRNMIDTGEISALKRSNTELEKDIEVIEARVSLLELEQSQYKRKL